MFKQRTLQHSINATGVGLHTGRKVLLTLQPAPPDLGVVFRRMDVGSVVELSATTENVGDTRLATTLVGKGVRICTIEHLMAALAACGVDNLYVDLDGDEVPIMDGSAAPFVFLLQSAGIREQNAPKKFIRIKHPVRVEDGDKWAMLEPHEGTRVTMTINFDHPLFSGDHNHASVDLSTTSFIREVSRARTFGFVREVEKLREQNLALGGSLDNVVVVDDYRVINEDGLRYPDEFVRHKILDVVGDMYVLGHWLLGAFSGYKSGHAMNHLLRQAVLADSDSWEVLTFPDEDKAPVNLTQPIPAASASY